MFEEDGYFIVNSKEESDEVEKFLIKNNYSAYKGNYYTPKCKIIRVYPPDPKQNNIKEYNFLSFIDIGMIRLELSNYIKNSIESKIREIFDNPNNGIACHTIEEKNKLFNLLDKLGYKSVFNESYINMTKIPHSYKDTSKYINISNGRQGEIKLGFKSGKNIIYFSDLKNLIKE